MLSMAKYLVRLGAILTIITLSLTYFLYQWSLKPVDQENTSTQVFVIPQGQSAQTIAKRLEDQNLIKNHLAFKLLVSKKDYGNKLQAGDFKLSPSMDLETILESLTHGSLDFWITFPEGLRVEEYAKKLSKEIDIDINEFILLAKPHEGRLFPDTYLIPQTASSKDIVTLLTSTFDKKSPTQKTSDIILASLIEREAKHNKDRFLVSSVLHNRIELSMPLQIDATIQYAIGSPPLWWKKDLTFQDLKIDSPYNTYLNLGLPPQPIANPGLASLEAVLRPPKTDYLYYVSDSSGYNHYATDLEGHQQNIQTYLK